MASTSSASGWAISDDSDDETDLSLLPLSHSIPNPNVKSSKVYASPSQVLQKKKTTPDVEIKEECPFGSRCYRKNPKHLQELTHPSKQYETETKRIKIESGSTDPLAVWHESSPLNYLLTTVYGIPDQYNYYHPSTPLSSLHLKDILSLKFGDLIETVQFNYCINVSWFIDQLPFSKRQIPILFVHGERGADYSEIDPKLFPNIKTCKVELPPFGTHHTKMMFLLYKSGIRIIIHTSNLVAKDWHQKTQGMWISPLLSPLKNGDSEAKSSFSFKRDLVEYLQTYRKHSSLLRWISIIEEHDLSAVKVVLIGSVPGRHKDSAQYKWGHLKLQRVLNHYVEQSDVAGWPIIGQFSSIGSLGSSKDKWLCNEWLKSLSAAKTKKFGAISSDGGVAPLKLIFPTLENVRMSLEGYPAGGSIPYNFSVAQKQIWLENFLHNWKSRHLVRTQASPHIKTYTRISKDFSKAAWFLLTSANLSKAAWGALEKKNSQIAIKSYELGVLFLPKRFYPDAEKNVFDLTSESGSRPDLVLPYSTPLIPYAKSDEPWVWDISHKSLPDRHGNMWVPSR